MRHVTWLLTILTLAGVGARLMPETLSAVPFLPNLASLTPWFTLTAMFALLACLWPRRRAKGRRGRRVGAVLMVACLALETSWQAPFLSKGRGLVVPQVSAASDAATEPAGDMTLRVMTCNVFKGQADAADVVAIVRSQHVQVLALQETTSDFVRRLEAAGINALLPYAVRASSDGIYGNGVWSSLPLADTRTDDVGSSASAMPGGTVTIGGPSASAQVHLVSVHTCSPSIGHWGLWRRSIGELGVVRDRAAGDPSRRYVLLGDFNATYDHAPFREMLGGSLHDAAHDAGEGLTATWPADLTVPPAFCGIDHVVTSDGVTPSDLATGRVGGTDHLALLCTLRF